MDWEEEGEGRRAREGGDGRDLCATASRPHAWGNSYYGDVEMQSSSRYKTVKLCHNSRGGASTGAAVIKGRGQCIRRPRCSGLCHLQGEIHSQLICMKRTNQQKKQQLQNKTIAKELTLHIHIQFSLSFRFFELILWLFFVFFGVFEKLKPSKLWFYSLLNSYLSMFTSMFFFSSFFLVLIVVEVPLEEGPPASQSLCATSQSDLAALWAAWGAALQFILVSFSSSKSNK